MNEIFNQMMSLHRREGADGERNALYEVMQQIVLCGLYRGGFFNEARKARRDPLAADMHSICVKSKNPVLIA